MNCCRWVVRLPKARTCSARGCARSKKLVEAVDRLEEKVKALKLQMTDRKASKEVAMGTRLRARAKFSFLLSWHVGAWCKKHDLSIEKNNSRRRMQCEDFMDVEKIDSGKLYRVQER